MIEERQYQQGPKRRILSIDGGGILGTFPAAFLAELEQHLKYPIGAYFDLIAGTSTGGILAIGLAMGLPASKLLDLYEKRGPDVFGQNHDALQGSVYRILRGIQWLYRRKYDSNALRSALQDVFGNKRIGEATTRLMVPAWNPVAQCVYIYKTAHHPRLKTDYRSSAVDAALATSAAPTYFQHHITQHDVGLLDGGVWANNPIGIAAVEAITVLDWPRDSLHILSLGCLAETYAISKWAGIGTLGRNIFQLFMDGQSHGAMGIAKLITGHEHDRPAIYRIDHTVPKNTYKMDDTRVIQELKGLGHTKARDRQPVLEPVFFDQPADAFTPVYQLNEEGKRCWTLEYAEQDGIGFHLDVLPSVPDPRRPLDTAIAITNKKENVYTWSASDPKGYGFWFDRQNKAAFEFVRTAQKRAILVESANIYASIDDVPDALVHTSLQRSIQLMKRHRDIMFDKEQNNKYAPISIIITTLAAQFYQNEPDIYSALYNIVTQLHAHAVLVENGTVNRSLAPHSPIKRMPDGGWYIGNPVNPEENFADRWHEDNYARARAFFHWVAALKEDLFDILEEPHLNVLHERLSATLGAAVVSKHFDLIASGVAAESSVPRIHISKSTSTRPWRA